MRCAVCPGGAGASARYALGFFRHPKKFLTGESCNCMVTHYAEPIGYIFGGSDVSCFGRSHASRRSRSAAAGKPACWQHRGSLPSLSSGNLEAPAIAAPGASGARTSRRSPPRLSAQSRTIASCGFLARALPYFLEREPGQLESIRGGRTGKRNAGAQTQMRGTTGKHSKHVPRSFPKPA